MTDINDTQPKKSRGLQNALDEDTQQRIPVGAPPPYDEYYNEGMPAPPRFLLIGTMLLIMLGIVGFLSGIVVFREVLSQGQQQRVIDMAPFMEVFQETVPTPEGGIVQRPQDVDTGAAEDLLNLGLDGDGPAPINPPAAAAEVTTEPTTQPEPTATAEVTAEATPEATAEVTPTSPPTTTPAPTAEVTPEAAAPAEENDDAPAVAQAPANTTTGTNGTAAGGIGGGTAPVSPVNTAQSWGVCTFNTGFVDYRQTWNNCGPASVSIALSYYGWQNSMDYAANILRPNSDDKNVRPEEMVAFVNEQSDIQALWRMGGDLNLLRTLIYNEFPVIVERGQRFEGTDWLGHYQTLVGYDDNTRTFIAYDSFLDNPGGNGVAQSYDELDSYWREFNRIFIVLYPPSREARLMELLGEHADPQRAAEIALVAAQADALADRADAHAFFNMGTSLTALGRFEEAAAAFDLAFAQEALPFRILWYQFGPYEAYYNVGRHSDVLSLAESNIANSTNNVEELQYWRGRSFMALGNTEQARAAFNRAINLNRNYQAPRTAMDSL